MSVLIRGTPSGRGAALPKTALEPGQPRPPPRPRFVDQAGAAAVGVLFQRERANSCNERPSSALRRGCGQGWEPPFPHVSPWLADKKRKP